MNNRHVNKTIRNALNLPLDDCMELVAMLILKYAYDNSVDGQVVTEQETDIKVNNMTVSINFKIDGIK